MNAKQSGISIEGTVLDNDVSFPRLLAEPNIRRLWITQLCSSGGESLSQIAMPLLVYSLTGSARMVGLMALIIILPRVILAPITGLLADRLDRRRLMIGADLARLILVSLVPLTISIWQLSVLAVLIAVGNATGRPAELAAVPSVAGPKRLVATLSLMQVSNGIVRIAMPAVGAGVIAAAGPGPAIWIQALCFAGSLLALRKLVIPRLEDEPDPSNRQRNVLVEAKEEMWSGIQAIRSIPIVRGVTASEALFQIVMGAMIVAGVVYTQETLRLGDRAEAAFALMTTSLSAGAVIGASIAHRIEQRISRPYMLAMGYLGPFFLVTAFFQPDMPVIYAAWFCFGFLDALAVISFQAYLAEAVPERLRGRVYAAWGAVVALAGAIAYYGLGLVTPWLGAPLTFAIAGITVGFGAPLLLLSTGAIRSVRQLPA
jgi:MFS family permease